MWYIVEIIVTEIYCNWFKVDWKTSAYIPNPLTRFVDVDVKAAAERYNVSWRSITQDNT